MLDALERRKKAAVASPVVVGGAAALISYLARMKKLNDEIECNNGLHAKLMERENAEAKPTSQPGSASTRVDAFIGWAEGRMVRQTKWELKKSDAFISALESDIDAWAHARDGGIAAAVAAAMALVVYATLRSLRRRGKRKDEIARASAPQRERKVARSMDDLAHAKTELKPPEKPPYYGQYHSRLAKKLKRQMGEHAPLVAEIALMAFPPATIHMVMDDPSDLGPFIGAQRAYYERFCLELLKRGLKPEDIFFNMDLPPKKPLA
jgi:hypothetical protein